MNKIFIHYSLSGNGDSDSDASKLGAYDKDNCLCNPCFALGK